MENKNYLRTKCACFFSYIAMASIFAMPPILFVTFHDMYDISYTLLGTLVLVNFCTQLSIDLLFSFFTKYFNIKLSVRLMPLLTSVGLITFAVIPMLAPSHAYIGLLIGTVIFSVSAGLSEVLLSPIIAALPSDNPERDMSLLHSLYAWGVLFVVVISTLFLKIFGPDRWFYLALFFASLPIILFVLFSISPIPDMQSGTDSSVKKNDKSRRIGLALCVLCIFLGGATETVMTTWISAYMESALGISKTVGDILGLALFAALLGLGRVLYAKFGKNITKILLIGMTGSVLCYLTAGLVPGFIIPAIACVLTGLCTSMLWPGTLILMEEKIKSPGVVAYALMASGGDFGASVAPQLLGIIVDKISVSQFAINLGDSLSLSPETVGMKIGMLISAIFPIIGIGVIIYIRKHFKNTEQN